MNVSTSATSPSTERVVHEAPPRRREQDARHPGEDRDREHRLRASVDVEVVGLRERREHRSRRGHDAAARAATTRAPRPRRPRELGAASVGLLDGLDGRMVAHTARVRGFAIVAAVDAEILARVPITFGTLDGSPQHAPLVVGSVGGIETRLVLDTGLRGAHRARRSSSTGSGSTVEPGEEGVDHSGATMPSWSVEDVELSLGRSRWRSATSSRSPRPPPFPSKGIGGILSPQHLHPSAVTVIDLVGRRAAARRRPTTTRSPPGSASARLAW